MIFNRIVDYLSVLNGREKNVCVEILVDKIWKIAGNNHQNGLK